MHLTGTHVASPAGRLYKFRGALHELPPSALACFDPAFVASMTSCAAPESVPSVSTVLAATVANDGLRFWRAKVGEEEANRVSATAAAKGTAMHSEIEKFLSKGGADAGAKDLLVEGGNAGNELLQSMSGVINSIALHDNRSCTHNKQHHYLTTSQPHKLTTTILPLEAFPRTACKPLRALLGFPLAERYRTARRSLPRYSKRAAA